jgi:hypothetical protein
MIELYAFRLYNIHQTSAPKIKILRTLSGAVLANNLLLMVSKFLILADSVVSANSKIGEFWVLD